MSIRSVYVAADRPTSSRGCRSLRPINGKEPSGVIGSRRLEAALVRRSGWMQIRLVPARLTIGMRMRELSSF